MKIVKTENEDLVKEFNALSAANRTKKKEIFELKKSFEKKSETFESQLKDLEAFKAHKVAKEHTEKQREKKMKKKAKRELKKRS